MASALSNLEPLATFSLMIDIPMFLLGCIDASIGIFGRLLDMLLISIFEFRPDQDLDVGRAPVRM